MSKEVAVLYVESFLYNHHWPAPSQNQKSMVRCRSSIDLTYRAESLIVAVPAVAGI